MDRFTNEAVDETTRHQRAMERVWSVPREHVPWMVVAGDIRHRIHGRGSIGRFNSRVAVAVTRAVGTMWAAYLFVLIALVSLPQAAAAFAAGDTLTGVTWLSQSFLQLVLLPIIIVGQNVISAAQEARAAADHETLTALQALNVEQLKLLEHQAAVMEQLRERAAG